MKFEDMTVPELRDLADKHEVTIPSDARKDDIIAALKKAKVKPPGNGGEEGAGEGEGDKAAAPKAGAKPKVTPLTEPEPPVDPYADFAVPDGTKPIINQVNPGLSVLAMVFDGSNVMENDVDHLVFVQTGASQEWLTGENAGRKFVQDKDGQVYYNPHGVPQNDEFKTVNVIEMGT